MGHRKTLYDILEIEPHADMVSIWVAYERLSKQFNPMLPENADDPNAAAQYQLVRTAYLTLSNPSARALYNRSLEEPEIRLERTAAAVGPSNPQWIAVSLVALTGVLVSVVWYLAR